LGLQSVMTGRARLSRLGFGGGAIDDVVAGDVIGVVKVEVADVVGRGGLKLGFEEDAVEEVAVVD
jgi:hypothetical protein